MCGIWGLLKTKGVKTCKRDYNYAHLAAEMMRHRGPDDAGIWKDENCVFAFRRLSIIDLSHSGHQPMTSICKRYVLIYNGELYNYQLLKRELESLGYKFCSSSDTEVILNSLIEWGTDAFDKFNGMYALGFYDKIKKELLIARDHVGMKPLYYSFLQNNFVFGSQLDHVVNYFNNANLSISLKGLSFFLTIGYYPPPYSVYNEINQLKAGHWLKIDSTGKFIFGCHYNLGDQYLKYQSKKPSEAELENSLYNSVQRHLLSDVPVGTFLSGGLDSGLISFYVGKAKRHEKFDTFTFSNNGHIYFDESEQAQKVAQYLNVRHHLVNCPKNGLIDAILKLNHAYSEPFADYSSLPTLMVTAYAKNYVKVLLSGDGSDEFFFGYNRMSGMLKGSRYYFLPYLFRRLLKKIFPQLPRITYYDLNDMIFEANRISNNYDLITLGFRINYKELAEEYLGPFDIKLFPADILIKLNSAYQYFQQQLLKVDRASMFNSVEVRIPFADKEVLKNTISFNSRDCTEQNFRIRKIPMRRLYEKSYPNIILAHGRKKGFSIPMSELLQNDLRDFFLDNLRTETIFSSIIDLKSYSNIFDKSETYKPSPMFAWALLSLQLWSNRSLNL